MSVLICVPTYENIAPETFKSIYGLKMAEGQGRPMFDFIKGYGCAQARNLCAKEALDYKFDYLMFVDSDIILPDDALVNMLDIEADIVLGTYPRRNTEGGIIEAFWNDGPDFTHNLTTLDIEKSDSVRIDVKGGGLGCSLIKTDLIKKMEYPYFKYVEYPDGSRLSEDNYFCWRAADFGASIQVDTRVRCHHRFVSWVK